MSREKATERVFDDVQPKGVKLHKHQDTGTYQDPRDGTVGCPVGPTGVDGATGGVDPTTLDRASWGLNQEPEPVKWEEVPQEVTPVLSASERGVVLTKEERLEAENAQLRILVLMNRKEAVIAELQKELGKIHSGLEEQRQIVTALQAELTAKYQIDFTKEMLESGTGRVIPAPEKKS